MSELEVEYRWLLFNRTTREAYFGPDYDIKDSSGPMCHGLYAFPPGTMMMRHSHYGASPAMIVDTARKWAESVCVPMRRAMPRDEWENLVELTAYYAWLDEGQPKGKAAEHWNTAAEQLADLLVTEYVFVKFEQPEVSDGLDEENTHGEDAESKLDSSGSSGSCKRERTLEEHRCDGRKSGLISRDGLYDGSLVAAKEACFQETQE